MSDVRTVLFFSDAPYEGGAERYVEYLLTGLPPGWRVAVIARDRLALDGWVARLEQGGATIHRARDSTGGLLWTLFDVTRRTKPSIVHLNLPHSYSAFYSLAAPVARLAGARRVVSTEHLTMIGAMRLRGRLRALASRFIDRIITLSQSNRNDLVHAHHIPDAVIRVVMNGVPDLPAVDDAGRRAARFELGASEGEVLVVHVGALTARKGHRTLLEALARLPDHPWRVALVGDGEDERPLRGLVAHLGLGDRVRFAGRRADVERVLAAADVVVLPSTLEGIPLVLLEALAVGRPAVATTIYGVPEIYGPSTAALLVPPSDAAALANALSRLLSDDVLRREMGRAARQLFLDRFTASRMARETVMIYEEALA